MAETTAYIGLGSNLGERKGNIDKALKMLAETGKIVIGPLSDVIETPPLASTEQPDYLNAVAEVRTSLTAQELRRMFSEIEAALGRVRHGKWWPRPIDLDLLLFGDEVINTPPELTVPHSQMHLRSFVLAGLCQLNPNLVHPLMNETVSELAGRLGGQDFALNSDVPQLVGIAGNIGVGKTTLARKLAARLGCGLVLEPYDTNPFMPDVYAGKKELALDSQLYFLTRRAEQLSPDALAEGQVCISDYVFHKEMIYARRLLDAEQLALYERIYSPFATKVAAPVLVVYMRDPAANCLERIHNRNRPYEQQIEVTFLQGLDEDYERLFEHWRACPVIRVSTSQASDVDHLALQIDYYTAGQFAAAGGAGRAAISSSK
ncbi:MAG: 2-amino-4-hydroxy-6-hydroxymethyldihydropteridine diphosphokinase [Phycisphaerales bacterium]|nr:MAG: 2-amino-4-hydroxy-6-hydroxymethyldihydropteridine diphosphokinase [Phycisphaerales bacterium]